MLLSMNSPSITPKQYQAWLRYQAALKAYRAARYDAALGEGRN